MGPWGHQTAGGPQATRSLIARDFYWGHASDGISDEEHRLEYVDPNYTREQWCRRLNCSETLASERFKTTISLQCHDSRRLHDGVNQGVRKHGRSLLW